MTKYTTKSKKIKQKWTRPENFDLHCQKLTFGGATQGFFQIIRESTKRTQKLNLELSFETESSERKKISWLSKNLSFLLVSSVTRKKSDLIFIGFDLCLWYANSYHYFSTRIIFINEAVSWLKSVFKTCSTWEYLLYFPWELLPYEFEKPHTTYFFHSKIFSEIQNIEIFTKKQRVWFRFLSIFYRRNNVFKYRISFSSLSKSFCVKLFFCIL